MSLALIAACAANGVIGRDNAIPWRLPADLRRFRRLTMGHPVIVGRRTFESIGRPLPGRRLIVVSRRPAYAPPGVHVARSIPEAIDKAGAADPIFVAGGADLYAQTIGLAGRLYLTRLAESYDGDALFPDVEPAAWRLTRIERHPAAGGAPAYDDLIYDRV